MLVSEILPSKANEVGLSGEVLDGSGEGGLEGRSGSVETKHQIRNPQILDPGSPILDRGCWNPEPGGRRAGFAIRTPRQLGIGTQKTNITH